MSKSSRQSRHAGSCEPHASQTPPQQVCTVKTTHRCCQSPTGTQGAQQRGFADAGQRTSSSLRAARLAVLWVLDFLGHMQAHCAERPGVGKGGWAPTTSHPLRPTTQLTPTAAGLEPPPPHRGFLPSSQTHSHAGQKLHPAPALLHLPADRVSAGRRLAAGGQAGGGTAAAHIHLGPPPLSLPP